MRVNIQKYLLLLIFSVVALGAWATVSEYTFTSSQAAYNVISGGTVLGTATNDNDNFNALPLGFTFTYNGVAYTEVSVQTNGFIAMGSTVTTSNVAISAATGTNNIVAAMNRDLKSRPEGEMMYLLSGAAPNRVFTVQWMHYRRVPTTTANDDLSFQIQLHENGNKVMFVYGSINAITATTAAAIQVGLRGDSNADFNNRTTSTDWSATSAGTAANNNCTLSATVYPASGLSFEFTPAAAGQPPLAAQNPYPADAAINVPRAVTLSWAGGGGTIDGFKLYFGTDNPPTNIVNGTTQTEMTYQSAPLTYNTPYYWKVIPYNTHGDAIDCPVWSFTTLADPTVSTYPFVENFDTVTPVALPLGWTTINANGDDYTWETYAGNADTEPNSARIRYNNTQAMNDWLLMPPMQFVAGLHYKVKFSYRSASSTYSEKLALYWGSAPTVDGMPNQIFVNENVNLATYTPVEVIVTPTTSGVYHFGFKGYSAADMFYLYLDTISIHEFTELLNPPTGLTATVNGLNVHLAWTAPIPQNRELLGYKVYRGTTLVSTITGPTTVTYDDNALTPGNYSYTVTANYSSGESDPTAPATATVAVLDPPTDLTAEVTGANVHLEWAAPGGTPPPPVGFVDGFETYPDFALTFAPWTLVDVDLSTTYGMTGITWTNAYAAMAYMVFNPSATVPAVTDLAPHAGAKMVASFASTAPPNNDWMITPQITVAAGNVLKFWAKSYTAQYGLERFKVGVSTSGTAPANFTIVSGATYVSAPIEWTEYTYDLTAYAGQQVYLGIQCLSNDAFIFVVDDVFVGSPAKSPSFPAVAFVTGTANRTAGEAISAPSQATTLTRELLGYKVYRDGTLVATIPSAATLTYDDMALAVGTYSYTVTANYSAGESVPAGPVTATITPTLLAPTNLTAAVNGNDVTLDWDNPEPPAQGDWITWCQDVVGNSVGTNAAAVFDVAHRWTQADLAPYAGRTLTQLKFVPAFESCVYTVKIWTGGSATSAGTLVSSQVVPTFTIGEWNLVILNTPVPIPTTGDLYYGFEVNTTGGYPAGCDDGPQIEGKGNMMYFEGAWTTLTGLAPTLTYNWSIKAFAQSGTTSKAVELKPIAENRNFAPVSGTLSAQRFTPSRNDRAITGYKVYRDGTLISTINDPGITAYTEMDLANGTYTYGVTATHTTGESAPVTVEAVVNVVLSPAIFTDGFEEYPDFAATFAPWTLLDVDQSATYGITGIEFPGSAGAMSYIVFNPSATTPPITTLTTHGGAKMAASFAATAPPNNDWLVTPRAHLGTGSAIKFYAKSHTAQYGLERFRVGVSTLATVIPQGFTYITGPDFVEAPIAWTEYIYDLSAYDGQNVYIGIRCVSNDAFVFYVDDFTIHSTGGTAGDDPTAPVLQNALIGNYPNPFNPETTIRFSTATSGPVNIDIYNLKGQLVKSLVNEAKASGSHSVVWNGMDENNHPVSSGVYYYKMQAGKFSNTRKMILMK